MQNSKRKNTLIVKPERHAYGGFLIGRHRGKIMIIDGHALPGETVEVALNAEKKGYYTASVNKIIEPSPYRIQPSCKFFGLCGGCHFQHIDYRMQVQLKEEIAKDCLKRITGIETELDVPLTGGNPWHYRLRGQFKAAHEKVGFYRGKTREVIDVDNCPLMSVGFNDDLLKARSLCKGLSISEIHLSKGDCSTVLLKTHGANLPKTSSSTFVSRFLDSGFSGVCVLSGDNRMKNFGKQYITLNMGNLIYTVSALSFFQSNWKLNQKAAMLIKGSLTSFKSEKILDLYAGAGNFSLPLAGDAEIVAVEENPYAVEDGKRNLALNRVKGYSIICSPVEKFRISRSFDTILLDPPRTGLSQIVINNVMESLPDRVVYLSCNPATFSRDLKKLLKKYDIESVRIIDFFPQTFHIELLAFLKSTR